jgi:hypothetical protein
LFRDRSSLVNVGYGVVSRDIPAANNEETNPNPNSSFISKALEDKPVLKFVSTSVATLAGTFIANKLLSKGGIKLATTIQRSADAGSHLGRRFVENAAKIKKALDELEGVNRFVADGIDPYERLINRSADGSVIRPTLTKLTGDSYVSDGTMWMTSSEFRATRSGREPVAVWGFRDEIQQKLIRGARSLPLTLPSTYLVQKVVTDPIFGNKDEQSRVKWYNPVDVVTDFVKQSTLNITNLLIPQGLAGAANQRIKSLIDSQYLDFPLPLTRGQQKTANKFADIRTILTSFGQDSEKLIQQATRISSSAGYAFSTSVQESQARQGGLVFSLRDARRGARSARLASEASGESKLKTAGKTALSYLFGHKRASDQAEFLGAIDAIPSLRGVTVGARNFSKDFRNAKTAYDVIHGAIAYDEALGYVSGNPSQVRKILNSTISEIKRQHKSRISQFAKGSLLSKDVFGLEGANEPDTRGDFTFAFAQDEYLKSVYGELTSLGADPSSARSMISGLKITGLNTSKNISQRITFGIGRIDSVQDSDSEFFELITKKANKELKNRGRALDVDQVKRAFIKTDLHFQDENFRESLQQRAILAYQGVRDKVLTPSASKIVRPQKALYEEFSGAIPENKLDYLGRRAAQKLGIRLTNSFGELTDRTIIGRELAKRGIDANNVEQLRSFLVDQKLMTRPSNIGGFNIFGLRQVTVDKAFDIGTFEGLTPAEREEARLLFADIARKDPVSRSVGFSTVRGVYETRSGGFADTTSLRVGAQKQVRTLSQDVGIPLVRFNPLQMLGIGGPRRIDPTQEIQFIPAASRQDFISGGGENAKVYAWVKERGGLFGSLGKIFSVSETTGMENNVKEIPGLFKAVSSIDTDIYARASRLATGRQSYRDSELTASEIGEGLSRSERLKLAFDVDEEQPNSLLRKLGRFRKRKVDIRNESTFARLFGSQEISRRGGRNLRFKVDGDLVSVVDEANSEIFNPTEVVEAFEDFRIAAQGRATPLRAIDEIERALSIQPFSFGKTSQLSGQELISAGEEALERFSSLRADLSSGGIEVSGLSRSARALERILQESNALSSYVATTKTSTITTRQDYLRNILHRFNVEMATYEGFGGNPIEVTKRIEQVLKTLKDSGQISNLQLTEARAAALGTIFNLSAMQSYGESAQRGLIASRSLKFLIQAQSDNAFKNSFQSLLSPFTSQSISNVNAQGAGRLINLIRPSLKRAFGTAPYQLGPNAVNPLGNMGTTFVPTLGTVLNRASRGETTFTKVAANVLGITSYRDPLTYSSASIPSIHLSDRLNRYFETVGLGVQSENYSGPISAFYYGMGIKRVLPIAAIGTTALAVDRTVGGMVNERDARGERVYAPFVTTKLARGAVEAQSLMSGLVPGGMGYEEKKQQLLEGEVPIKQGRFWPLGVTPFEGGKTMYYRPSYYRRLASGSTYTSDAFKSPLERLAYGYDFSPLRPFDPYRFERQHYFDRPYPVTGEYFTGQFGPITPFLNMTIGKLLKPQVEMHSEEVASALSQYVPAGYSGAYNPTGLISSGRVSPVIGGGVASQSSGAESSPIVGLQIGSYNNSVSTNIQPLNTARNISFDSIGAMNSAYQQSAFYGPPPVPGYIPPNIVAAGRPISQSGMSYQLSEFGYRMQEMAGIYGFAFANVRESLGLGRSDFQPNAPVLQSAAKAYGSTRSFWDLNLGGLGDLPGQDLSIELSEITRRFIPKERTDVNYLNPIQNTMGLRYPFLPGSDYFINFKTGDPFTKVQEGELRLPGVAYERLNPTRRDYTDPVTQLDIIADVAPYSRQFRSLNRTLQMGGLEPSERIEVERIRAQVEETTKRNTFSPYKYRNKTAEELGVRESTRAMLSMGEYMAHRDTFINTKFFPSRTAQEDWERRNVYGSTFPEWQRPIESFIQPIYYKATQRNPVAAGIITAGVGAMFGKTAPTRAAGALIGLSTGTMYSSYQNARETFTGERFIPKERKKQLALEEYTDILNYVKNRSLAARAAEVGDMASAAQFGQAARRTMYGADLYGSSVDTLSLAVPKRKREHFKAMIEEQDPLERERILSTAPRLERRIYQAAWGMPVEEKPDLVEYFSRHELPDLSWEGWHPNTNMEHIKIKVGQSMGINMSQMGYYPQQIREANLTNPSYPGFSMSQDSSMVAARLRMIMSRNNISRNSISSK